MPLSKCHILECWRLFQNPLHVDCIGESLRIVQEQLDPKNFYLCNPEFDKCCGV